MSMGCQSAYLRIGHPSRSCSLWRAWKQAVLTILGSTSIIKCLLWRICKWSRVVGNGFRVQIWRIPQEVTVALLHTIILPLHHPSSIHCWLFGATAGAPAAPKWVGAWLQVLGRSKNTRIRDHPTISPKVGATKKRMNPTSRFNIWLSSSFPCTPRWREHVFSQLH